MSLHETIVNRLQAAFPDAKISLNDTTGTNDHWEVVLVSEAFRGLSRVKRHQAVYRPLQDLIHSNEVHALKISTRLPEEA